MKLKVCFFATLKDRAGVPETMIDVGEPAAVSDLLNKLFLIFPQLIPYRQRMLIAVNREFADLSQILQSDDEIALFPPVSGG
jgi:molybdopterin converting factor subunit 1